MGDVEDELFASLGGSLMKNLLGELQSDDGEDNLWSLDQLERELASLDQPSNPPMMPPTFSSSTGSAPPPPGLSAAALIVDHAQDKVPSYEIPQSKVADAWSASLEKFTAMALDEDFLAADSAKKAREPSLLSPTFLGDALDYDVNETITVQTPTKLPLNLNRPPGIPSPNKAPAPINPIAQSLSRPNYGKSATKEKELLSSSSSTVNPQGSVSVVQEAFPLDVVSRKTPQNSLATISDRDLSSLPPATPQNSMAQLPEVDLPPQTNSIPDMKAPGGSGSMAAQRPPIPQLLPHLQQHTITMQPKMIPAQPMMTNLPQPMAGIPHQSGIPPPVMAPIVAQPVMQTPSPKRRPDAPWQHPPQPQMIIPPAQPIPHYPHPPHQPTVRLYCDVRVGAPTIPATALESSMMKSRDLAYVIHSIMKPILMMGESPNDYHNILRERQSMLSPSAKKSMSKAKKLEKEMRSREQVSMSHMKEKSTLGHTAKANVARPRALIATPKVMKEEEENTEQKKRASLWKARVYVDQGYAAMNDILIFRRERALGQRQSHKPNLTRLLKCLGMSWKKSEGSDDVLYEIDVDKSITSILKLSKGRTFLARVLQLETLPIKAVLAFLPPTIGASLRVPDTADDPTDNRLFSAFSSVILRLEMLPPETVLSLVDEVQTKEALASQARMECVHGLLRRGSHMAAQDPSFAGDWRTAEDKFMELLG